MIISPPRQTFRQTYNSRFAIAVVLLTTAIIVYFIAADAKWPFGNAAVGALVVLTVVLWFVIGKIELTIHDEGVRYKSLFGVKELEWRQVREYRYRVVPVQGGGLIGYAMLAAARRAGGRAATTNLYLTLIGDDGRKLSVTSFFKDAYDAVGMILGALHQQLRPKVDAEVHSTGAAFGPLRLTLRDLQWKSKDPVPLGELMSADIAGQSLRIRKKGKMLSLVSVRSDKVPNVLLLLETMEKLGVGAGAAPAVDPLARVRI